METKDSHKIIRENYAISRYLKMPYDEVSKMNKNERSYMYEIIKNALETDRSPKDLMCAEYKKTKGKLFTIENEAGTDISYKDVKLMNVVDEVEIEALFDVLTFNSEYNSTSTFGFSLDPNQRVYVKTNDKIEDISKNDMIYLEIFNRMYVVNKAIIINAFELGGNYYMLNILRHIKQDGTQSA